MPAGEDADRPAPVAGSSGTAEPQAPVQWAFDRIEPVFTTPPGGPSLGEATTWADAPAIFPSLRKTADPAPEAAVPQQRAPEEATNAVLPPPQFVTPPPGYPGAAGYPSYHATATPQGYAAQPGQAGQPVPPHQGQPGMPYAGAGMPPTYAGSPGAAGYAGAPGMPGTPGMPPGQAAPGPWTGQPGQPAPGQWVPGMPQGQPAPGQWTGQPGQPAPGQWTGQPGQWMPGQGYPPGMPPGPGMPSPGAPEAPRKKHTARNVVLTVITAAVLLGMPGVAAALTAAPAATKPITLPQLPEPVDTTKVGDATRDRATVVSRGVAKVLADQEKAMTDRDEATFVKAVATSAAANALKLRFRNLSSMKVAEFHLSAEFPQSQGGSRWKSTLTIEYCFGKPGCSRDAVKEPAVWQDTANGPRLVSLGVQPVGEDWFEQPQPWEQTPLVAAVGQRVVVAAPSSLKSRLSTLVKEADKAAAVADTYAVGTKPDFYRIYLANKTEWRTWFGNKPSKWVAGYTTATGNNHGDVVINNDEAPNSYLPTMLRHEMTHAASTYGKHYSRDMWWEIEGYAQLAEPAMKPALRSFIRSYIHNSWGGKLPADAPSAGASANSVTGQYGVAFAAMSYLQKKYGKQAVIDFFDKTVRNGLSMDSASKEVFKASWSSVHADVVKGVRAF